MSGDQNQQAVMPALPMKNQGQAVGQARKPSSSPASPFFLIGLGVFLTLIGISASLFDIQATESVVTGGKLTSFTPNWGVLGQPFLIAGLGGQSLQASVAGAYYVGWIVELSSLILVVAFDMALEAIYHAPKWVIDAFKYTIFVIAGADIITNYMFEPEIGNWVVRVIVAATIAVASFFFPIVGIWFIEKGVKSW